MSVTDTRPKPGFWYDLGQHVIPAIITAVLGGIVTLGGTLYYLGGSHQQTENRLTTIDNAITDVKRDVGDVRVEQAKVRSDLSAEHDKAKDTAASVQSLANDLTAGRAQTRARLDALELQSRSTAEALATIKQVLLDSKDTIAGLAGSLERHSDDLAAIREALAVPRNDKPRPPYGR